MKILDSNEKRKWNLHKADYSGESISVRPGGKAWANILTKGSVSIGLMGKKISGGGDVTLRILQQGGGILFSKDIKFSKKSWTEIKINIDYASIKNAIKLELVRSSRSYGRVEIGRVVVKEDRANDDKSPPKKSKKVAENALIYHQKKRIAVIIPYGIYGGGEVYLKNLFKDIGDDFSVDFLYMAKNKLEEQDVDRSISHISARSLNKLSAILSGNFYDTIIFYNSRRVYEAISSLKQSGDIRSKVIEIYHSDFRWSDAVSSLKEREGVDALLRVSQGLAEDISGIPVDEIKTLPVGVDTDLFIRSIRKNYAIKSNLKIPKDKVIFGMVSRLSPEKNIKYAIELVKDNNKAHLIIVGNGPDGAYLHNFLKDNNIKNVSLVGYKTNVVDYYNIFDALLLTSKMEGTPISILEAMSCGLPIYSTDVGKIRLNFGHLSNFYFLSGDEPSDTNLLGARGRGDNFYENLRDYVVSNHNSKVNSELFFDYLRNISLSTMPISPDTYTLSGEYI